MSNKQLTPMLQQYMQIKQNTNDALVFYRLGDFYELFFEDAITASKVLDLVLTSRSAGQNEKAPMAGVPHHAARNYIQKLVQAGYKVAIVEQVEDPKEVKGIVKREVVEIVTPGTFIDNEDDHSREIASIHQDLVYATIVSCNVVTGSIQAIRVMNEFSDIVKTLQQFQVKEIVVGEDCDAHMIQEIKNKTDIYVSHSDTLVIQRRHSDTAIERALNRLLNYLEYTHKKSLGHLGEVLVLNDTAYLKMDYSTMTNLELIDHQKGKELSLYHFLNKTKTNMGSRMMKQVLMKPLVHVEAIQKRHATIDCLMRQGMLQESLGILLKETYDIHRIIARLATDKHNAQDFIRLKQTLFAFSKIQDLMKQEAVFDFVTDVNALEAVAQSLELAFREDAPVQLKEGRTFKKGIHEELDHLLEISSNGKQWLLNYEETQREITGIKNLKVGYNRAFGYYIEISKGQVENVKEDFGYIRKQTLTNAERYIAQELQEFEIESTQASEKILKLETQLFDQYTEYVHQVSHEIHHIGDVLAMLDVYYAFSMISLLPGYTKPRFTSERVLNISKGRHPVLESTLKDHQYISSDTHIDENKHTLILTGPNMGGKSTYMRMVALNVIMAQAGCYVPCESFELGLVDQIFTRMGASDDILLGQSTFMVEMIEAQAALTNATKNSLILFDEIGRGTSTYDGMALAQAIIEHINNAIQARTVFSTHYHELTQLDTMYEGIENVHVEVHEENDHVTFLYRVISGKADKSYGINVARLAHLPHAIVERAQENLERLERSKETINIDSKIIRIEVEPSAYTNIKQRIQNLDINQVSPIESLLILQDIQKILKDGEDHE